MNRPTTLSELRRSGWTSRNVKAELRANLLTALNTKESLFPGIVGYDSTVIPDIVVALLAGHDMLFLGEKGQGKTRLMRMLTRFLDEYVPFIDGCPLHDNPLAPICQNCKRRVASGEDVPISWWHRDQRYAERLAPGTKFADVIGEIDPAKLASGTHMSAEDSLHFGLIPRMNRGLFAMNEVPELDELVQVGLFNILEERDVQIRGYPIKFDLDVLVLFSANPATYNRSGKVIPQLKDRIGSVIQTHYPRDRETGILIMEQEAAVDLGGDFPVMVPFFMKEIVEEMTIQARRSKYIDHQSGVSARFSIANYRAMVASARRRAAMLGEKPAVPRISDLDYCLSASLGKLELDLMSSSQLTELQVLENIQSEAIRTVFEEHADKHGLEEIAQIFGKGVKIEVGDLLPSAAYADRLTRVPPVWEKAFEISPSQNPAMRASCVEFVLAGLHAGQKISRAKSRGRISYDLK